MAEEDEEAAPAHADVLASVTEARGLTVKPAQDADTIESLRAEIDALKAQVSVLLDAAAWQLS